EDGIRDFHVTGVQTCALPIFIDFAVPYAPAATRNGLWPAGRMTDAARPLWKTRAPSTNPKRSSASMSNWACLRSRRRSRARANPDRESVVYGQDVTVGGCRNI